MMKMIINGAVIRTYDNKNTLIKRFITPTPTAEMSVAFTLSKDGNLRKNRVSATCSYIEKEDKTYDAV